MRGFSPARLCVLGALTASVAACTGTIIDDQPTAPLPGGGGGSSNPTGGGGSTRPADPNAAGPLPLQRLTNVEYNNTVRDLLGDTTQPAGQFASDRNTTFEFRRAGDVAVQDATLFRTAAESLAAAATPKLVAGALLPCDPATGGEDACAQKFIATFGQRAFRRPLSSDETMRLTTFYSTARTSLKLSFTDAVGLLIEAMLQAPQFLYHWEAAPADAPIHDGSVVRLGAYQVASRLSYFVWGSMPDDQLLVAAGAGQLDTAAGVQTAARRLLADPKAKETVARFFNDWLALDNLGSRSKDLTAYPKYTADVQQAMLDETSTFVENVAFGGDGRLTTLLSAPYSFVNSTVAPLYGAQVASTTPQKTDLDPAQRAGFLTHASFLALTGAPSGSNPVLRGKAVYTKLLCNVLPPPPANVPPPKPASAGGTTRQRFVEHDQNACAKACHAAMDPIGFAFENYDGIGQYRTMDNGQPVDATGSLMLDGTMQSFNDAVGLAGLLAKSSDVRTCFAGEWSRFALARMDTDADAASLQATAKAFSADTATVQDLMAAVAAMRSFRFRSLSPGESP